ncbi:unnamed protein product [Brugia pahangi]|uniref:Glycoprotein n=1 Tax=Brugia pahangi TaxID=6280 RepID=A0A0N4SZP8_BRUPA|nr:unnamed protein product [Brugia pahangi]
MSIHIIMIIPLLSLIFPFIYCSSNYTVETFPDSLVRPDLCNLSSPGFACDPDQLLKRFNHTLSGAEYLSKHLQRIRYATNCPCLEVDKSYGYCPSNNSHGYTISVAIIRSIGMNSDKTMNGEDLNHTIQIFAEMLRRRQNRGQCADDALIVAVADWKAVYTSVGEVIGRALTSNIIMRINREAESLFVNANYLYGLTFMVNRYGQILQHSMQSSEIKSWWMIWSRIMDSWLNIFLSLIVIISFIILVILVIIRFCCSEKQSYTVGRQFID